MIYGFNNLNYEQRLNKTGLISLEQRRVREDLIHMFKMSKKVESFSTVFRFNNSSSLKGNKLKIVKSRCKLNLRKIFFNNRIVNVWNKLPSVVVCGRNTNAFKNNLDKIN